VTNAFDAFDAQRGIFAGYLMADLLRLDPVRVIGGARYEVATVDLTLGNSLGVTDAMIERVHRNDGAILPAVNVVYALGSRSNLRGAYSITVARPHLRELSRAPFFDYVRRRVVSGNPELAQTSIHNGDLRYELFLDGGELFAASAFYKYFQQPIERTVTPAGDGFNLNFVNADSARSYGLELEARLTGARFSRKLSPFYLGANLSLIQSRIRGEMVERPLQGQSPYTANAELGFRRARTTVSVLYNVFGPRISEVGKAGNGDVFEEPVHRLDATWSQGLGRQWTLKLSATNLLNQRTAFTQGDTVSSLPRVEIFAYRLGVSGLATLEWSYENGKEQ
jgi:outer membrane receptor protein involved in Fe transport